MKKKLNIKNKNIEFLLKHSSKSKYVRLMIKPGYGLVVTKPKFVPYSYVENFIINKADWILSRLKKISIGDSEIGTRRDYLKNKIKAYNLVSEKVKFFNGLYNFNINKIFIKNQRTLWGSCSALGNLNFSYKLVYLPDELINYLAVHELCHLKEMNHSCRFWSLVEKTLPDYKVLRRRLKKFL